MKTIIAILLLLTLAQANLIIQLDQTNYEIQPNSTTYTTLNVQNTGTTEITTIIIECTPCNFGNKIHTNYTTIGTLPPKTGGKLSLNLTTPNIHLTEQTNKTYHHTITATSDQQTTTQDFTIHIPYQNIPIPPPPTCTNPIIQYTPIYIPQYINHTEYVNITQYIDREVNVTIEVPVYHYINQTINHTEYVNVTQYVDREVNVTIEVPIIEYKNKTITEYVPRYQTITQNNTIIQYIDREIEIPVTQYVDREIIKEIPANNTPPTIHLLNNTKKEDIITTITGLTTLQNIIPPTTFILLPIIAYMIWKNKYDNPTKKTQKHPQEEDEYEELLGPKVTQQ